MPAPIVIQVKLGRKKIPANARAIEEVPLDAELKDVGNLGADAGKQLGGALRLERWHLAEENRAGSTETSWHCADRHDRSADPSASEQPIIKTGFDFEKSMNDLTAATKPTNEQLRQATALAKQLGNDLTLPRRFLANDAAQSHDNVSEVWAVVRIRHGKRCEVRYYWRQRRALTRRRWRRFKATRSIRSSCKRQMPGAWRIMFGGVGEFDVG